MIYGQKSVLVRNIEIICQLFLGLMKSAGWGFAGWWAQVGLAGADLAAVGGAVLGTDGAT